MIISQLKREAELFTNKKPSKNTIQTKRGKTLLEASLNILNFYNFCIKQSHFIQK